ncbi:MAG TPA: flavodoxin family protein [Acidobacteriota bacterium]|nr:flavodoxin family protein [Acidobacteriota bacterium]
MSDDTSKPRVVKGMDSVQLSKEEFRKRFLQHFYDPAFDAVKKELNAVLEVAWDGYEKYRKNPRSEKAGKDFVDPEFKLPVEWLETRKQIMEAERIQRDGHSPSRILLINGAPRSDQTCPGEMSKTWRLIEIVRKTIQNEKNFEVDVLDLSRLASEYGRVIYPCKACVSTAMPLCHWPCSCYPNHAMGQTGDWMNEIYPRWSAAHGVMIICPVHWYQSPSALKLMIDRLVCADGGNPDPTSTRGKDPARAKSLELQGWNYPRHLAGRAFAIVVHGDAGGVEDLERNLVDWLSDMELIPASPHAGLGRYVGYYKPYATSHDDFERDQDFQTEVKNRTLSLVYMVRQIREGKYQRSDKDLKDPRQK